MVVKAVDNLVGVDIQLLLLFPLDIGATGATQHFQETGAVGLVRDGFGGQRDVVEETGKFPLRLLWLIFQDETLDRNNFLQ